MYKYFLQCTKTDPHDIDEPIIPNRKSKVVHNHLKSSVITWEPNRS